MRNKMEENALKHREHMHAGRKIGKADYAYSHEAKHLDKGEMHESHYKPNNHIDTKD